jgi:ribose transport system permease protein
MKRILGVLTVLLVVLITTAIAEPDSFLGAYNLQNLMNRIGLFGILSIGAAFVIITGGIDLSIGSVVGLIGCLLPYFLVDQELSIPVALVTIILISLVMGLSHGLLITKLRLQPFVVTLCGLLIYRGFARWLTGDSTQHFGTGFKSLRSVARGKVPLPFVEDFAIPIPFLITIGLAIIAAIFLNKTVFGRYLLALGRNEQAARYSGIKTDRMIILAYVICSLLAGLGGILFTLELNGVQPSSHGEFYELYAIAAAVLGGCSLRGGEGSITGVLIGAALMQALYNSINLLGMPTELEFAIIGTVILVGVIADELVKRFAERRRAIAEARASATTK